MNSNLSKEELELLKMLTKAVSNKTTQKVAED